MGQFLLWSIIGSIVLTLLVNLFPGLLRPFLPRDVPEARDEPGIKFYVPWKAMLILSIALTVGLNLIFWLR